MYVKSNAEEPKNPSFVSLIKLLFYVLLTAQLGIIFVNNQLDAQFFFMSHPNLHTKRSSIQSNIYQMSY